MNNKSNIALFINGTKVYTRKVMPHKKYTHAAVLADNPTQIVSCSTCGKFYRNTSSSLVILPVVWTDDRNATVTLTLSADELNAVTTRMQGVIAKREKAGYSVGEMNERLAIAMELWGDAIEAENPVEAPEVEDREAFAKAYDAVVGVPTDSKPAKKAPKAKKAKVSTETEEKMMQRFLGQCREMLRKAGAEKVEWLMQRAASEIAN